MKSSWGRVSAPVPVLLAVLGVAACSAEQRCSEQAVEEATVQYRTLRDANEGALQRHEAVVATGMLVSQASTQRATGQWQGCVESLKEARQALRRAEKAARS